MIIADDASIDFVVPGYPTMFCKSVLLGYAAFILKPIMNRWKAKPPSLMQGMQKPTQLVIIKWLLA
jgi:hypothetical protein